MTRYCIACRGGLLDGSVIIYESDAKPGDIIKLGHESYELVDSAVARISYEEGETPSHLACGAIYVDPERN